MSRFDVIGVGLNATDTILRVPAFPPCGGKVAFRGEEYSVGGQVATAIVACAALGLRTKYIGTVGDDLRGRIQLESLEKSGVNIDHVRQRTNCPNQSAYIVIDESTGERTVFWNHADCLALSPDEIAPEQIVSARMLHIDGHDIAAVQHAASIARANRIPVTADVDTVVAGLDSVFPLVDYLISSAEFPARFTKIDNPFEALQAIRTRFNMRIAAMTMGLQGALACTENGFLYSAGFAVNCVDTTGAGDVFHGGFCYAVLQQMPIAEALDFANAMAALNCTAIGARGGIAPLENVQNLLRSGERRRNSAIESGACSR